MPSTRVQLETGNPSTVFSHDAERLVAQKHGLLWIDLTSPTEVELAKLQKTFEFHPLSIEDSRHFRQRAKVDPYEGYLFITLYSHRYDDVSKSIIPEELHVFLGSNYLVTVHQNPLPALSAARSRFERETEALKKGADFFLYLIVDELVDSYFPLLDQIANRIDALEERIEFEPDRSLMQEIFSLKQQLIYLRRVAGPQREVFLALSTRHLEMINSHVAVYFQDVYDHGVRIYEMVDTLRDLLGNALDAYYSATSIHLNEVMKRLTLIATIFMPLTFITGFGGMNFNHIPFNDAKAFALLVIIMILVPALMWFWFKKKKWL
jgi:magnesium transporter